MLKHLVVKAWRVTTVQPALSQYHIVAFSTQDQARECIQRMQAHFGFLFFQIVSCIMQLFNREGKLLMV